MTDQRVWTHGAPAGYGIIFLRRGGEKQLVFRGGHPADTEFFSGWDKAIQEDLSAPISKPLAIINPWYH